MTHGQQDQDGPNWHSQRPESSQRDYSQPQSNAYPPPLRQRRPRKGLRIFAFGSVAFLVFVILAVALGSKNNSSTPGTAAPALTASAAVQTQAAAPAAHPGTAAAKAAAAHTLTYAVTGSPANVTYGPAGTNVSGTVPLRATGPLGSPLYYAITAQLQGSGTVTCEILIDGHAVSRSTASGGYNIASCEISRDPLSGQWTDTNSS